MACLSPRPVPSSSSRVWLDSTMITVMQLNANSMPYDTLSVLYIPIATPTINLNTANSQYVFGKADKRLKSAIMNPNKNTMIFLPNLSASTPPTSAPRIQPTNKREEEIVPYMALSHTRSNCETKIKTKSDVPIYNCHPIVKGSTPVGRTPIVFVTNRIKHFYYLFGRLKKVTSHLFQHHHVPLIDFKS